MSKEVKDKGLQCLFTQEEVPVLPTGLNRRIMQNVVKTQKRREVRNIVLLICFSLTVIGGIFYFLPDVAFRPSGGIFRNMLLSIKEWDVSGLSFYFFIGIVVGVLLLADYRLRKTFLKR